MPPLSEPWLKAQLSLLSNPPLGHPLPCSVLVPVAWAAHCGIGGAFSSVSEVLKCHWKKSINILNLKVEQQNN